MFFFLKKTPIAMESINRNDSGGFILGCRSLFVCFLTLVFPLDKTRDIIYNNKLF